MMFTRRSGIVLLLVGMALLATSTSSEAARRALLIGNDQYRSVRTLSNAKADAQAMAAALKLAGYTVEMAADLDLRQMQATLRDFKGKVQEGDEVVFFFSGHGVQIDNANFLLPTDIRSQNSEQVREDSIGLQRVLDDMAERKAGFSLMIIDACRNNPFKGKERSIGGRGLTRMSPASGQMIIFSAGTDQEALDKLGESDPVRNGLFTRVFLKEMMAPGVSVRQVLQNVRETVHAMAGKVRHTQVPAIYDEALGNFFIVPGSPSGQGDTGGLLRNDPNAAEIAWWTRLKDSKDGSAILAFLTAYPKGLFADAASARLGMLGVSVMAAGGDVPKTPGHAFRQCDVCPEMVVLPAGKFVATSGGKALAKDFAIGSSLAVSLREVTFGQWDACVAERACPSGISDEGWGRDRHPVVNVSWNDAKAYVAWLSRKTGQTYRLLRDAEWEYAARGGSAEAYPWGNDAGFENANCLQCGAAGFAGKQTTEVGKFAANGFGLFDVIGNVWEWVEDCDSSTMKAVSEPATDSGGCSARILRGGSFKTAAHEANLARRRPGSPVVRSSQNGFRVARDL
jgi:formylglycine-generating enzyme required for sulfatase activity